MIQQIKYIVLRDEEGLIVGMWTSGAAAGRALGVSRQTILNNLSNSPNRAARRSTRIKGTLSEEIMNVDVPTAEEKFINLEGEEWKRINGYEDYEISNYGRVRKDFKLKQIKPSYGYCHTSFTKNGERQDVYIHRLVAEHFLPDWDPQLVVNHKDENKQNNHVSNLEMMTIAENFEYSRNLHREEWGAKISAANKDRKGVAVRCIETGIVYDTIALAAEATGISREGISRCCKGLQQTGGKLHWEYADVKPKKKLS